MPRCFRPTSATQFISTHPHPRSPRSRELPDSRPDSLEESPVHAGQPASAGPLDHLQALHLPTPWRPSPSDVSVVIPACSPRPLSRACARTWITLGHLDDPRRDAVNAFMTRAVFRRTLFECHSLRRRLASLSRRVASPRTSTLLEVRLLDRRRFLFAFASSRSPEGAREVFPLG